MATLKNQAKCIIQKQWRIKNNLHIQAISFIFLPNPKLSLLFLKNIFFFFWFLFRTQHHKLSKPSWQLNLKPIICFQCSLGISFISTLGFFSLSTHFFFGGGYHFEFFSFYTPQECILFYLHFLTNPCCIPNTLIIFYFSAILFRRFNHPNKPQTFVNPT